jgi:hypothetical protein
MVCEHMDAVQKEVLSFPDRALNHSVRSAIVVGVSSWQLQAQIGTVSSSHGHGQQIHYVTHSTNAHSAIIRNKF